jgi:hypothetical protein
LINRYFLVVGLPRKNFTRVFPARQGKKSTGAEEALLTPLVRGEVRQLECSGATGRRLRAIFDQIQPFFTFDPVLVRDVSWNRCVSTLTGAGERRLGGG